MGQHVQIFIPQSLKSIFLGKLLVCTEATRRRELLPLLMASRASSAASEARASSKCLKWTIPKHAVASVLQKNYSVQCALMVASLVAKVALATSYDSATWSDAARQIHQTSKILEACSVPSTISLCSCMAFVCMVCASEINSLRTVCFVSHKHFKLHNFKQSTHSECKCTRSTICFFCRELGPRIYVNAQQKSYAINVAKLN